MRKKLRSHHAIRAILTPSVFFILLAACSISLHSGNSSSSRVAPIIIAERTMEGIWQNSEIKILFQQRTLNGSLQLSGKLYLSDAITQSYPIVRYLYLNLLILDKSNTIIGKKAIPVQYSSYGFTEEYYPVNINMYLSGEAASFTFSYQGTFADYGEIFPDTHYIAY